MLTPTRSRRRLRRIVGVSLVALLAGALALTHDPSPVGHWRTPAGEAAYRAAYAEALALMPPPTRTFDVATDWGTVHGYVWESPAVAGRTPLALFPGWASGVPMWSANLRGLASEMSIYAFDALGDAGLSVQTKPLASNADQAEWIDQAFAGLGLERVHVMGHSFGGWLTANYAARKPGRVASALLVDPPFVFGPLPLPVILKSIPGSIPWLPSSWREAMLADIGGGPLDERDPVARMIALAVEHYAPKKPTPEQLTPEQLRALRMRVYVAFAGRSLLWDAEGSARVARTLPRATVRVWPDASHSLPMEYPGELDAAVASFVRQG